MTHPKTAALARQIVNEALEGMAGDIFALIGDAAVPSQGGDYDRLTHLAFEEAQADRSEPSELPHYTQASKAAFGLLDLLNDDKRAREIEDALYSLQAAHEAAGFALGLALGRRLGGAR